MSIELAQQLETQAAALRASANSAPPLPTFKSAAARTPLPPLPALTPAPTANIQALVQQEVARQLAAMAPPAAPPAPAQGHVEQALMVLLEQSITPAEMEWVRGHIAEGGPGFVEFLQSDTVKAVMQMGFEAYKEFLSGRRK